MLSVIVETLDSEDALPRTLSTLVAGAVEGLVRDVLVLDRGSRDRTAEAADHAGCVVLEGVGLSAAIRSARGEWLLFLEPGARLAEGWTEAVRQHMGEGAGPARFSRAATDRGSLLARWFGRARPLAEGLLIPKAQALRLAPEAGEAAALARAVRAVRLAAAIRPAAPG